jgi:lysozyme
MLRISPVGLALIKSFESLRLRAYDDATGKDVPPGSRAKGILTIGYGHTGPDVFVGQIITPLQAEALLATDLAEVERGVNRLVSVDLTQYQFDALVSFAFNCGLDIDVDTRAEGLGDSSLLRYVNAGKFDLAYNEFPKWNKDNGKVLAGLVRRRAAERTLFAGGDWRHPL